MTKHLQNLERLHKKMTVRYGDADDLVLQLRQEVSALEKKTSRDLAAKNLARRQVDYEAPAHLKH